MSHSVQLPHPDRREPTVGTGECGWSVVYEWGHHGEAIRSAGEHIEAEALTEWVESAELSGDRFVSPGRSL